YGGVDRVFRDIKPGPEIIVVSLFLREWPELFLHFVGGLPRSDDNLADAAHGLAIRRHDGARTEIMQNVLGGYGFLADPALGEGNVLRNTAVEMMGNHQHIERLVQCVHGVRSCRSRRRRDDVRFAADLYDVRGMSAAGALGMKSVNGSALKRGHGLFDKTALVQRVGVEQDLYIHVIGDR